MTVSAPPPRDELELLIREARSRQRRRRIGVAAALAAAAGLGLGLNAVLGGGRASGTRPGGAVAAQAPRCRSGQLRLAGGFGGAGAGNAWFDFAFTNVSATTCALKGWPTLELRFASGRVLTVRAHNRYIDAKGAAVPVRRVLLRPDTAASFAMHVASAHNGGLPCPSSTAVAAVPPGGGAAVPARLARVADVPAVVWACAGKASVSPLAAGAKREYNTQ
ncbi:MAG TPA: DUF4232 domain-containing protein [Gaiellaceae bacterium]|nr:DUF4232 domain-containing protein [Gaiellaceae bacterium]